MPVHSSFMAQFFTQIDRAETRMLGDNRQETGLTASSLVVFLSLLLDLSHVFEVCAGLKLRYCV